MAQNVSGQVRATRKAKPAAKPAEAKATAKPTATRRGAKPAAKSPATGQASKSATMSLDELQAIPADERNDAHRSRIKELKKEAAFAKLRERAQAKKAERVQERGAEMSTITKKHPEGSIRYLTRASYYGCKVRVEGFDEVRGRNLVTVTVLTTKTGQDLEEDQQYTRRVSGKFLTAEKPTEKYQRGSRRGRPADESTEAEAEVEDTGAEDEADVDELEEEDTEEEPEDETADEEDETEATDEEDEDTWGDDEDEEE